MSYFNLPASTIVNRFIPKNAFDDYTNTKQKKKFVDLIDKITWTNKLTKKTINLEGKEINEVQVFEIKIKVKSDIKEILEIIDKSIPYHIIFILSYEDSMMISTSQKHLNPLNHDNAVVDWRFNTDWFIASENKFQLNLKKNIDFIYADLCAQITGYAIEKRNINDIVKYNQQITNLKSQIQLLENKIKSEKQFNKKVELNLELKKLKENIIKILF